MVDEQQSFGGLEVHGLESVRLIAAGVWQAKCCCGETRDRATRDAARNVMMTSHLIPIANRKIAQGGAR